MRIAVCDDDKRIVREISGIIATYFKNQNLAVPQIDIFYNGDDLLAAEEKYSLLFLDVKMPGTDGIEVARRLKADNPYLLIIILTDYDSYLDDALKYHVFRYITKPIDVNRINKNLAHAIEEIEEQEDKITVEHENTSYIIGVTEIIMVEYNERLFIYTEKGIIEKNETIEYWSDKLLKHSCFYQSNRGYIVNLKYVSGFDESTVLLSDRNKKTYRAVLTKRKYSEFKRIMFKYLER